MQITKDIEELLLKGLWYNCIESGSDKKKTIYCRP